MKWETRKIKADSKLALEKRKHEVYCPKCKWTNHIYAFQGDRIVCKIVELIFIKIKKVSSNTK